MDSDSIFQQLFKLIAQYHKDQGKGTFVAYHEPEKLKKLLELDSRKEEGDWQEVFGWVEKYLHYAVKTGHPGYVNRMWAGANLPSIVGEIVTAVTNTSACTYETAPVSTLMEQYMFQEMLNLVGFENGVAQMTTGSSNANMIAMMAARNTAAASCKETGLFGGTPMQAFVNKDAHYSMDRAAAILGLGTKNLIKVAVDNHGRMDTTALEQHLLRAEQQGKIPFFVVATAGTTVRGAYDSIKKLLALRDKYGFWLHVDGAWGGAVVVDDGLRSRFLAGLEEADSFTVDFHKMFGTALMCNVLLFNRRSKILREICSSGDESYIFRTGADGELRDLGSQSLQCGRKVDSLKWFLDWKFYGRKGFAKRINRYLALISHAETLIEQSPELELLVPRESFNLCFHHIPPHGVDAREFNTQLRNRMQARERSLVGTGFVDGRFALRLLVTNDNIDVPELEAFFEHVLVTGQELARTTG